MAPWEPSGFVKLTGFKIIRRSAESSEAELFIREDLCNRRGVMHGGAVMGWADTMGGPALKDGERTATIESKTNFFAPIRKGDTARAVCTPLHSGCSTIVLQTNITRGDGKLAAIVTQTRIVLPAKAGGGISGGPRFSRACPLTPPRAEEARGDPLPQGERVRSLRRARRFHSPKPTLINGAVSASSLDYRDHDAA